LGLIDEKVMAKSSNQGIKVIATNRRARFDYDLLDRFEAGIVLTGSEIKAVRNNQVSLQQSYVRSHRSELWLMDAHIAPYEFADHEEQDPKRPRKLLLHRRELNKIIDALTVKGLTMVPTKIYLKDGWAKLEIALARGRKHFDKRANIAKRDAERQVERALREKYRK
jgi:SsrA-binding protein